VSAPYVTIPANAHAGWPVEVVPRPVITPRGPGVSVSGSVPPLRETLSTVSTPCVEVGHVRLQGAWEKRSPFSPEKKDQGGVGLPLERRTLATGLRTTPSSATAWR
jgi:hypothetical protein